MTHSRRPHHVVRRIVPSMVAAVAAAATCTTTSHADIALPPHLASHMVVQRDAPIVLRGSVEPGASVVGRFGADRVSVVADDTGRFRLEFPPRPADGVGRPIELESGSDRRVLEDVLVGEVWLCSGQSNMQWAVAACDRFDELKADANRPMLRTFNAALVAATEARDAVPGQWLVCSPETVGAFSGSAYHFGRTLIDQLDVPIGLVHASWGGSKAEAWTSLEALAETAPGRRALEDWRAYERMMAAPVDEYAAADVDDDAWALGPVPGITSAFGIEDAVDGIFWWRLSLDIPAAWAGRELQLSLGPIDDHDETYWNGARIGATRGWDRPRRYRVPGEAVAAGRATLAIRVTDTGGPGGLHGRPGDLFVHPVDDPADRRSLPGEARVIVAGAAPSMPAQHRPGQLYHGMLHPLRDVPVRGVIWYQGESNGMGEGAAADYAQVLPRMIRDWRSALGDEELPFLIVQIANLAYRVPDWDFPGVRDVQRRMLELPATGLAVTTDIGDPDDIHPRNKHDVGDRLARWALVDVYEIDGIVKSGPLVERAWRTPIGSVIVEFEAFTDELGGGDRTGIARRRIGGFEVAGDDGVFVTTTARASRDTTVQLARPEGIEVIRRVRYAWRPDPVEADLVNEAGLPAAAFEIEVRGAAPR